MQVWNSSPPLQITVGPLQQGSPPGVQNSPSCGPVQASQSAGSLEQLSAPVSSGTHAQPQQSAAVVQAPSSGTHSAPQRSTPSLSGTHTPPQQTSANAHSAPSGRQQSISPVRPSAQVISGKASVQHSSVVVHIMPGRVQSPSPPKQRRKPVPVGSQPVSPPPFGQQFELAPPSPHTSPAGKQLPALAQRMMGRPSSVRAVSSQTPLQHSADEEQSSSCTRQPPRNWQRGPVPSVSRQSVEQHEPFWPSVPQGSPALRHAPNSAQVPIAAPSGRSQSRLQQSASAVQASDCAAQAGLGAHTQSPSPAHAVPPEVLQRPLQQSAPAVHAMPIISQPVDSPQVPPSQTLEQHSLARVQAWSRARHISPSRPGASVAGPSVPGASTPAEPSGSPPGPSPQSQATVRERERRTRTGTRRIPPWYAGLLHVGKFRTCRKVGASGALLYPGRVPIHVLACRPEGETFQPAPSEVAALMEDPEVHLWVSLERAGERERALLTDTFRLHELLVEDALSVAHTPKAEVHEGYLYLIVHGLEPAVAKGPPTKRDTVDVDFFVSERFVVTHHRTPVRSLEVVRAEVRKDPELLRRGPAHVAHRLIDMMVDELLPWMEAIDEEIAEVEGAAVADPDPALLRRIFALKHVLQRLRRVGLHQRGILHRLAEGHYPHVPDEMRPFFRDVDDHFVQVMDLSESYRDLVASALDAYLSMQSHRLNEVMKILTIISTIMLPLTFITGLYGMNFDAMPGIHWKYGYEMAWAVMLLSAVGSFVWMKKRGWI